MENSRHLRSMNVLSNVTGFVVADVTVDVTDDVTDDVTGVAAEDNVERLLREATIYVDLLINPIVMAVGLIGNALSFVTFTFGSLRMTSLAVYLSFVAVADFTFIGCVLIMWINNLGVSFSTLPVFCQALFFLSSFSSFLSIWYVVAFSVERYVAVCYPLRRLQVCTVRQAQRTVAALTCLAVIIYAYVPFVNVSRRRTENGERECVERPQHKQLVRTMHTFDTFVSLIAPSVLLIVLNARIVAAVLKIRHQRESLGVLHVSARRRLSQTRSTMTDEGHDATITGNGSRGEDVAGGSAPSCQSTEPLSTSTSSRVQSGSIRVKMLIVISLAFVVLCLPSHVFRIYVQFFVRPEDVSLRQIYSLQLFVYLSYHNYALNVVLYVLCGRNFRSSMRRLLLRCRRRRQRRDVGTYQLRSVHLTST